MIKAASISIIFSILSAPIAAACDYCQDAVNLTESSAACYLSLYQSEIEKMRENSMPAQLINLAVCDDVASQTRGAGFVPLPGKPVVQVTTSFLLDENGLLCLAEELRAVSWETAVNKDDVRTFQVKRDCEAN